MTAMEPHIKIARTLTDLLENKFGIGKFRIGLDPIIGLIPGVGDMVTLGISSYIVWIGVQLKLPQEKIIEMVGNVIVDFLIGLFPLIGDFSDVLYRANSKNMKIIEQYTNKFVEGEILN